MATRSKRAPRTKKTSPGLSTEVLAERVAQRHHDRLRREVEALTPNQEVRDQAFAVLQDMHETIFLAARNRNLRDYVLPVTKAGPVEESVVLAWDFHRDYAHLGGTGLAIRNLSMEILFAPGLTPRADLRGSGTVPLPTVRKRLSADLIKEVRDMALEAGSGLARRLRQPPPQQPKSKPKGTLHVG